MKCWLKFPAQDRPKEFFSARRARLASLHFVTLLNENGSSQAMRCCFSTLRQDSNIWTSSKQHSGIKVRRRPDLCESCEQENFGIDRPQTWKWLREDSKASY